MNYRGSYRKLLGNAKSAIMAAIEVYNKPNFQYRDECATILLLNAWELALKALLSKNGKSVFYRKKRGQPYRTLSWQDAFSKAREFFPSDFPPLPVQRNLELIGTYRDNAVHFYNTEGFGVVVYTLAQTSIKNFRDLLEGSFGIRLEDEINWQLLPLGIRPPIDIISYISGRGEQDERRSNAVKHFLSELADATDEVQGVGEDTGRLLTIFNVKLESVKKIGDADVVVGVARTEDSEAPLAIVRRQDPNITHPLRQKDVLQQIDDIHGRRFTSYVFQAIVWKYGFKKNMQYCWRAEEGVLTKYSNDIVPFIKRLTPSELSLALEDYRQYKRSQRQQRR